MSSRINSVFNTGSSSNPSAHDSSYVGKVAVFVVLAIVVCVVISWLISQSVSSASNSQEAVHSTSDTFTLQPSLQQGVNLMSTNTTTAVPANNWTVVSSYAGGPGVIKSLRINLSCATAPDNGPISSAHYIAITFDNAASPQVGTLASTPSIVAGTNLGLNVDAFFDTISIGQDYSAKYFGSSNTTNTNAYQYMTIDMPFSQGYSIRLFNNATTNGVAIPSMAWVTVEMATYPSGYAVSPLHFYAQPSSTWPVSASSTLPTAGQEYPLLSVSGSNGVFLKGVKTTMSGPPTGNTTGANWTDGRFAVYSSPSALTAPVSANHYTDSAKTMIGPYIAGAAVILTSNSTPDFFQCGPAFQSTPYSSLASGGLIYNENGENSSASIANAEITAYRIFEDVLPSVAAGQNLVLTYSLGTGVCSWITAVMYYA